MGANVVSAITQIALGDILNQRSLGLQLVVGTSDDYRRSVTGAHAIEIANPSRWVSSHWVALTTGLRLKGRPSAQRDLVAELSEKGIAALGFGLGVNFQRIPGALLDEAQQRKFPLFVVPFSTGFAEVIAFVNQSLASPHLNSLLRYVSMQDYLLSSLSEPDPLREVTQRMSRLLAMRIVVVQRNGNAFDSSSHPQVPVTDIVDSLEKQLSIDYPDRTDLVHLLPPRDERRPHVGLSTDRLSSIAQHISTVVDFQVGGEGATAVSVGIGDRQVGWLVAVELEPTDTESSSLRLPLLRSVAHLIGVAIAQQRSTSVTHYERQRNIVRELLPEHSTWAKADHTAHRSRAISDSLVNHGFGMDEPLTIASVRILEHNSHLRAPNGAEFEQMLEILQADVAVLLADHRKEDAVFVLPHACHEALSALPRILDVVVGVSGEVTAFGDAPKALTTARFAVQQHHGTRGRIDFSDLPLGTWLTGYAPPSILAKRSRALLERIADQPYLLETLRAYLSADLDITRAAERLGVHPNSLRYRLARIEERLGLSIHSVPDLVDL
ncbi:MAG: PucR family transcriptional regulator, partial [Acidimicrobiales bacterium]